MSEPTEPSPEESEILALILGFLGTRSWDEARQFADSNPELRDVDVVTMLANTAQESAETDKSYAEHLYQHAMWLCGTNNSDVAVLVAQIVGMTGAAGGRAANGPGTCVLVPQPRRY